MKNYLKMLYFNPNKKFEKFHRKIQLKLYLLVFIHLQHTECKKKKLFCPIQKINLTQARLKSGKPEQIVIKIKNQTED